MADNLHTDNHGDMRHCVSMETTPPAMPESLRPWKLNDSGVHACTRGWK